MSEFTTIRDDFESAEWPDSTQEIDTLVEGELADKVRAKTGKTGDVIIHERGQEGGYSEYTVEWYWEFSVEVGGSEVFSTDTNWGNAEFDKPANHWMNQGNGLASFLAWLNN